MMRYFRSFIEKKPVVVARKCIGCGICEQTCPLEDKAITVFQSGAARVAAYDYSKCIKCYCCQEMCPEKAITIKKSLLSKVIDRRWKV
jgi:formate hydrogenlyase subunit 6/NADH:ubiquinone oxidoreductase subunit I